MKTILFRERERDSSRSRLPDFGSRCPHPEASPDPSRHYGVPGGVRFQAGRCALFFVSMEGSNIMEETDAMVGCAVPAEYIKSVVMDTKKEKKKKYSEEWLMF